MNKNLRFITYVDTAQGSRVTEYRELLNELSLMDVRVEIKIMMDNISLSLSLSAFASVSVSFYVSLSLYFSSQCAFYKGFHYRHFP